MKVFVLTKEPKEIIQEYDVTKNYCGDTFLNGKQTVLSVLKEIDILEHLKKNHPYRTTLFPRDIGWASQLERDKGLTDDEITGVSGALCRMGYDAAVFNIRNFLEELEK